MFDPESIEKLIKTALPDAQVEARDMTGGGDHFEVSVKSEAFRNKSILNQHRLIYNALGDAMNGPIHALKINTEAI